MCWRIVPEEGYNARTHTHAHTHTVTHTQSHTHTHAHTRARARSPSHQVSAAHHPLVGSPCGPRHIVGVHTLCGAGPEQVVVDCAVP